MQNFIIRRLAARVVAGGAAAVAAFMNAAHAALPTEVTAAITGAQTDLLAAVGAVIAAMATVWGLRKLGQKMGWF
ncbi:major capsid protein [Malikia sp.]|uniref:major capsid protein n=1 Tax=Malikia sp. TaxID=2070706 RepID=UPI0026032367|nr:major capsid protein [Malikia sp.]MDD2730113.1 major capsid protein [Malikia sp.]